jgi:uncharacterized protein YegJ (DUF2314 family)
MIRALTLSLLLATPVAAQDPVTNYSDADPAMNAAIAQAQKSLPIFLANALDFEKIGLDGTGVKVAIPTVSREGHEHIWVTPFRMWEDGTMAGFLANAPADLGTLSEGDQVDFTTDQISDWSVISPEGLLYGNYTSRVMHGTGAFGDTPFDQIFAADPIPPDWQ